MTIMYGERLILISFYVDDFYYYNFPELLAYPNNLSYDRGFRYQDIWISEDLREEIDEDIGSFKDQNALLCMKFKTREIIIPLRIINITHIKKENNHYFFYFKVLNIINYIDKESIYDYSNFFIYTDKLAEFINSDIQNRLNIREDENVWINIITKVINSEDQYLNRFKNYVFYKIIKIIKDKKEKLIEINPEHFKSKNQWAFQFFPSTNYEIEVMHKIFINEDNERLSEFYKLILSGPFQENISELSSEVNSHYGIHKFSVKTYNEDYIGKKLKFNINKTIKLQNLDDPTKISSLEFKDLQIPSYLKASKYSKFTNNILPYIGFLIGSILATFGLQIHLALSIIGTILQTFSLINIPRRKK